MKHINGGKQMGIRILVVKQHQQQNNKKQH
jgi:hypothetical protein